MLRHINTILIRYSVCAITITRLAIASRLTTDDFTYDLARIAIVTDLEPLLGIIVACAPLFPPTLRVIMVGHKRKTSSAKTSSSGFARLNSKGERNLRHRTDDHSYNLTNVNLEGGMNETHITSPNSQPSCSLERSATDLGQAVDEQGSITVKRGWEIRTNLVR